MKVLFILLDFFEPRIISANIIVTFRVLYSFEKIELYIFGIVYPTHGNRRSLPILGEPAKDLKCLTIN